METARTLYSFVKVTLVQLLQQVWKGDCAGTWQLYAQCGVMRYTLKTAKLLTNHKRASELYARGGLRSYSPRNTTLHGGRKRWFNVSPRAVAIQCCQLVHYS